MPRTVTPFLNVTVPVGVPLNCGVTVAVNVTDCPETEGLTAELTVVVVEALLTVCETAPLVEPLKLLPLLPHPDPLSV